MLSREVRRLLTPADLVLMGVICALAAGLFALFGWGRGQGATVSGVADGEPWGPCSLSVEQSLRLHGPLGETVVEIAGGAVRIESSPCRHQICVSTNWIHRPGDLVACVPNRIVLRVDAGPSSAGLDGVTW